MHLKEKIETRKARGAVIGLGYVGLPLLVEFAKAGYDAVGIDLDQNKVNQIGKGISYIQDVPGEELNEYVQSGKLSATTDYSVLKDADIISICVPTPLRKSKSPDISYIVDACSKVAKYLTRGQLIILESTTYPGSTEEVVLPILLGKFQGEEYTEICAGKVLSETQGIMAESTAGQGSHKQLEGNGLKIGEDFYLAFSPERVDPGNDKYKTKNIPKVIGGVTSQCCELSTLFYKQLFPEIVPVSSTRAAEMVKLLENTFRSVNIALANEMKMMCDALDLNIWEIIEAAATKPFGFMPFYPGPGLGGHCIPIDPLYLIWKAKLHGIEPKFVELAGELNQKMPGYVVSGMQNKLNEICKSIKGSRILVVGVAYKKDISDMRESPALEIITLLKEKGADVSYYDPYIPEFAGDGLEMSSIEYNEENLKGFDGIIIATDHSNIDYGLIINNCKVLVDTRNAIVRYKNKNYDKVSNSI
ncbi:MAG: nucleotide sugar dehydrogenase [Elusimicrobiota bacterium]